MNTLWQKVWADVAWSKTRTLLVIFSIATGVFTVGTLFGMIDILLTKMDRAHQAASPAHLSLILSRPVDRQTIQRLAGVTDVAGVDGMRSASVVYRSTASQTWENAILMGRDAPHRQKYDLTRLQEGRWPQAGEIAVEYKSAEYKGLHIGDQLEFELDGQKQRVSVSGVVRHPFIKPPEFGGQILLFGDQTLFDSAAGFRQILLQTSQPYDEDKVRAVARRVKELLRDQQVGVNVTLMQNPNEHWGKPFLSGIHWVLQIMAGMALVLASVLIINTMSAHLSQQKHQIGVMKSMGATTWMLVAVYCAETLLLATAAVLTAVPFSVVSAHFSSCALLGNFNIACGDFAFSWRALGIMLLGGLLVPLAAVLLPVYTAASQPVKQLLDSHGVGYDFGRRRFDRWVEKVGSVCLPTLQAAALGNLFRRRLRFVWTQGLLVIAGLMFLLIMSLKNSVLTTIEHDLSASHYSVHLAFLGEPTERSVRSLLQPLPSVERLEFIWRRPITLYHDSEELQPKGRLGTQLFLVAPDSTLFAPILEDGRWLQAQDAGLHRLVMSADSAKLNGLQVGDWLTVQLGGHEEAWQIVGLYRWLNGTGFGVEPFYAVRGASAEADSMVRRVTYALIALSTNSPLPSAIDVFRDRLTTNGIRLDYFATYEKAQLRNFMLNPFKPIVRTLMWLAVMVAAVACIGIKGSLYLGVSQRLREMGVLRSIGATGRTVFGYIALEGFFHAVVAWSLSIPLAYALSEPVLHELGQIMLGIELDFAFDTVAVAYWLGLVLLLAGLGAYWPARYAAALSIKDSLAN